MVIFKGIIYEILFVLCEIEILSQIRVKFLYGLGVGTKMRGENKSYDLFSFLLVSVGKCLREGFRLFEFLHHDGFINVKESKEGKIIKF